MERFSNLASSTLSSSINSSVTSLTVADASLFPSSGNFRIVIDSELMICTTRSGNTLTVTRGAEGTTAASHTSAALVSHVLTKASLERAILEYGLKHSPTSLTFSWKNQGSATISSDDFGQVLKAPAEADTWQVRARVRSRATGNFKVTAGFSALLGNAPFGMAGIGVYNTTNDKLEILRFHNDSGDSYVSVVRGDQFGDPVGQAGDSTNYIANAIINPSAVWMQIEEISGVTYFRIGNNGIDWQEVFSKNVSTHLGTSDGIFFAVVPYSKAVSMRLFHWSEE